jgi:hypothetical protein
MAIRETGRSLTVNWGSFQRKKRPDPIAKLDPAAKKIKL